MKKVYCPSCGAENRPDARICKVCALPITHQTPPHVELISPDDDLFSDDVIPEKTKARELPQMSPILEPDEDTSEKYEASRYKLPAPRQIAFILGIVGVGIFLILLVTLFPSAPVHERQGESVSEIPTAEVPESAQAVNVTNQTASKVVSGSGYTLFDNFSDKESGWGSYEGDMFLRYYSQGEYHLIQKGENLSGRALLGKDVSDFVAEADVRLDSGPLTGQYGLIFRFDNGNYYSFGINGRGWYTVRKHMDGKVYELVPLTETYILNKGYATNRLGIKAEGNTLSIYINGKMVRAIADTSLSNGDLGFFVSRLAEQGFVKEQPVHVAFDNFKFGEL